MPADYELIKELGRGGMGVVMSARQASIDRTVALKRINPAEAGKPQSRQKFLAEAIVTGDLEHPNIVPIYDVAKDESGTLFYAMKHVKGTPWDRVIHSKGLQENLEILMKAADAVAFAHSRGVIHRDLKPENIMLGGFGEVLVMDWGLAMTVGPPSEEGRHGRHARLYGARNGRRPDGNSVSPATFICWRDPVRDRHGQVRRIPDQRLGLPDGGGRQRHPAAGKDERTDLHRPEGHGRRTAGSLRHRWRLAGRPAAVPGGRRKA